MNISFLTRLLGAFVLVLLLAFVGPYLYFRTVLSQEIFSEAVHEAGVLLEHVTRKYESNAFPDPASMQQWLKDMGRSLEVRLTFIAIGGKVLADSGLSLNEVEVLENHASRPEIIQARDEGRGSSIRFSDTLRIDFIYTARKISENGDIPAGYLRLAKPVSRLSIMLDTLGKEYAYVVILLMLVAVGVSFLLARQISRNISTMVETAEAIGKGEYTKRIRSYPAKEILPLATSINRMAESIDNHIQTITDQKEQLEATLNGMREGVMVLDAMGRIKSLNKAMERIFDIPPSPKGRQPIEIVRSPELQKQCEVIFNAPDPETLGPQKLMVETQDDRFYDVTIIPLGRRHTKLGAIIVFHEVTDLKRLERVRRDFVANVSHELRTPLTSIKGYAETLLDSDSPEKEMVKSFMEVVVKNANTMSNLLEDLLQLAKLESSESIPPFKNVNLDNALSSAWKFCIPLAETKRIELVRDFSPEEVEVLADYDQLVQVLRNLLENAVKYGPQNSTVSVSVAGHGDNEWAVTVRDNGPGVAKKDQDRIFERFYRVDKLRNGIPGTGLGLAICRHIVRNHGGRIWVDSPINPEGSGSTFVFTMKKAE